MGAESIDPASLFGRKLVCEHSDYAFGITSAGGVKRPENDSGISVFEEVLRPLPKWTITTKAVDGLVKVSRSLSL